jgi:hypothetical protein
MSRVGTTFLDLGKYLDGENPGSGPQDGTPTNGLNGDKDKIDLAVGTGHNADGTHKAAVIDAANLKSTVPDGSSLEQDATSKKLKIKALGVATEMLADDAVTKAKIAADTAGAGLKQNTDGSLSPDVDGTTITVNGTTGKLVVTQLSGLSIIPFSFNGTDEMATIGGRLSTASSGIPIPPGTVKKLNISTAAGSIASSTVELAVATRTNITVDKSALGGGEFLCAVIVGGSATGVTAGFASAEPIYGSIEYLPT